MSSIFISHSGQDNECAAEIKAWLEDLGYSDEAVFLDRDSETGIPAGSDWEREIYRGLDHCRAVLLLCSEHSMASRWCFAEVAHARALGKTIFPLVISECEVWQELLDTQFLDIGTDRQQGLDQLAGHLEGVVRDQWKFEWEPEGLRSPYPGLLAFEKKDAAIYFGRDEEIREGLTVLNRMRRFPGIRLAMVVGASGSGKSSLLRAGILPRLERDSRNWLLVDPFRPLGRPFDELALALEAAFEDVGAKRSREQIRTTLQRAAEQSPADGTALADMTRELTIAASRKRESCDRRQAMILLPIDQFEELLGPRRGDESGPFLRLLRAGLEADDSRLIAVGTLRSDFLELFQKDPALERIRFNGISVGAMSVSGFREVVTGPAEVHRLELEEGLADAMAQDCETEDALPLLAFALGELYELHRDESDGRRLRLADYRDKLGGLGAAVGRAADNVIEELRPSDQEKWNLRGALMSLVTIDDKGRYVRRPAQWSDLPPAQRLLEGFVEARLLKSHGDGETRTLEVRHEALFRTWAPMVRWLDENREFLLWCKRVVAACDRWLEDRRAEGNLLQGAPLAEAVHWLERRPPGLGDEIVEFIKTSARVARRDRNRKLGLATAVIAVVALLVSMIVAGNVQQARTREAWKRADHARTQAEFAEEEAVARSLRARRTEQQLNDLIEEICDEEAVENCMDRLRKERESKGR